MERRNDGDVAGDDEGIFGGVVPVSGQQLELGRLEFPCESGWGEFHILVLECGVALGANLAFANLKGLMAGERKKSKK